MAAIAGAFLACTDRSSGTAVQGMTLTRGHRLLACYLVGGLATVSATIAIGSLAPEMLAGEPAVALCAALTLRYAARMWQGRRARRIAGARVRQRGHMAMRLAPIFGLLVIVAQPLALRNDALAVQGLPSDSISCIAHLLQRAQPAHSPVLAPAYAAFLARREIVDGLADPFNWSLRLNRGDATARAQVEDVLLRLARGTIAAVVMVDANRLPDPIEHAAQTLYSASPRCPGVHVYLPPSAVTRS